METRERILTLIATKFKSRAEFERVAGLKPQTVNDWERKSESFYKCIPMLAKVLDTSLAYLHCETDNPEPHLKLIADKKESVSMNEKARDSLKKLDSMTNCALENNIFSKEKEGLYLIGITQQILEQWKSHDFLTNIPTAAQLQKLLEIYAKHKERNKNTQVELSRAINDYIYYSSQETRASGQPDVKENV